MKKKEIHRFSIDLGKCEIHYDNDIMKALDITIRVPEDFDFTDIDGNGTFWEINNESIIIYLSGPIDNASYRGRLKSISGHISNLEAFNYNVDGSFTLYIELRHKTTTFLPKTVGGSTVVGLG